MKKQSSQKKKAFSAAVLDAKEEDEPLATQLTPSNEKFKDATLETIPESLKTNIESSPQSIPHQEKRETEAEVQGGINDDKGGEDDDDDDDDDDGKVDSVDQPEKVLAKDRHIFEAIDRVQCDYIHNRETRVENIESLAIFMQNYTFKEMDFGRLYIRNKFCDILADNKSDEDLAKWHIVKWEKFLSRLEETKELCLRKDSCVCVMSAAAKENNERDNRLAKTRCFTSDYNIVHSACLINQMLAPFRLKLNKIVKDNKTGPPMISDVKVKALFNKASSHKNSIVQRFIFILFVRLDEENEDANSDFKNDLDPKKHLPRLKNVEDLVSILHERPFDLNWLIGKIDHLIQSWDLTLQEQSPPTKKVLPQSMAPSTCGQASIDLIQKPHPQPMTPHGYPGVAALDCLKQSRDALRDEHGEDPLETSREVAEKATGVPRKKHSLKENRMIAVASEELLHQNTNDNPKDNSIHEEDKNDDVDDDSKHKRARFDTVPPRHKDASRLNTDTEELEPSCGFYFGPPADDGIYDPLGHVTKRRMWTNAETNCLIAALMRNRELVGNWVTIKNMYPDQLRNRSTVQIKDKYRNIKRNLAIVGLPTYEDDENAGGEEEKVAFSEKKDKDDVGQDEDTVK